MNNEIDKKKYCHRCGAEYTESYVDSWSEDPYYNMKLEHKEICYFCGNKLDEKSFTVDDEFDKELTNKRKIKLKKMDEHDQEEFEKFCEQDNSNKPIINTPKCPICGSTNLSKISALQKAGKIGLFGIFGMGDNGKTWRCNGCGSKF